MATAPYFISEAQFVGEINLDFGKTGFDSTYAAEVEEEVLTNLLGLELYLALVADLDASNNPQTDKYTYLVDGIAAGYSDTTSILKRLKGIKEMLKYFFYCSYQSRNQSSQTTIGEIELESVNATKAKQSLYSLYVSAYNKGVVLYYELINYITYKNGAEGDDYYDGFYYQELDEMNIFGI